ncbi:pilus assembly protein [Dyella terrae]|uniref:pilus assembly protein n=1 Tax=Dyella terrae TaxID=522259 RepID=UPI001EFE1A24|nr:PilC/PilY family type IV pilus protein [Dyella terrae]ULU27716.1 pilus assembly protein PilY [Dyella terrae]
MRMPFHSSQPLAKFLGRLAGTSAMVCALGVLSAPAQAAVTVDSSPLIQRPTVPPNILLMLDDSGSMAWDVMPDYGYLSDTSASGLASASVNGVYYNPQTTYTAPPMADGTYYPNASFTNTWVNGFNQPDGTVNLSRYDGSQDSSRSGYSSSSIAYIKSVSGSSNTYSPTMVCASGDTGPLTSGDNIGKCQKTSGKTITYYAPNVPTCDSGSTYTSKSKLCTQSPVSVFTYTVQSATNSSSYTRYYIASHAGDCSAAGLSNCSESAADQQNAANWFAYYHTRILMAKSGLMAAFSGLSEKYRVGFGSIDGGDSSKGNGNYANLPSSRYKYADGYNGGNNYIAQVTPFGDGSSSTDQKNAFWTWVSKATASGGTPLRQALTAAGKYYQQAQPWSAMSSDPPTTKGAELACRQSYTILTTDGFWNEKDTNFSTPGNADNTSMGTAITGPNQASYKYVAAAPYADGDSNTLADVAFTYWSTDLRPNSLNEVPTSDDDPAFWQHMVTFTMGLGFTPTGISPSGTTIEQVFNWANGTYKPTQSWINSFSWPTPKADSINNIADLAHAALNSRGGFYSATSPTSFSAGLADALKRATSRTGSAASLSSNSTQLQTGTVTYQATYTTSKWTGDLLAYDVNSTTGAIDTKSKWTASSKLPAAADRNIYTTADGTTSIAFKVGADGGLPKLSTAQLTALGASTTAQTDVINYLRGDQTKEGTTGAAFRKRESLIGDIVSSQPVYVGAPSANQFLGQTFTGTDTFSTYASDNASRAGRLYVASNDGYLHAFDINGAETFAYLPGAVIQYGGPNGIADLTNKSYGDSNTGSPLHQYFNDGELAISDVYTASGWKTVLVGTTGRGLARTVYALDVTDATKFKLLWERSANDGNSDGNSKYIGQMIGKPVIAQTAAGKWSVLMGNGYNSAAGKAALLQFALTDGSMTVYSTTDGTGLAAPAVWIGTATNGVSTAAYGGDLDGNVWSFDLTDASSAGTLLFTATSDTAGKAPQPITAGMLMGKSSAGDLWLFFGTGKYLTLSDLTDTSTQSWYGLIIAKGTNSSSTPITDQTTKTRAKLVQRAITSETSATVDTSGNLSKSGGRTVTTTDEAKSMTGLSGWYMDLLQPVTGGTTKAQGERMVTPNQFQGSYLLGTTRIPNSDDPCNPAGTGWVMAVDPFTGTNPQTSFFDLNHDGKVDSSDYVNGKPSAGIGFNSLPNNPIFVGSSMLMSFDNGSNASIQTSGGGNNLTRISWREMINQ